MGRWSVIFRGADLVRGDLFNLLMKNLNDLGEPCDFSTLLGHLFAHFIQSVFLKSDP